MDIKHFNDKNELVTVFSDDRIWLSIGDNDQFIITYEMGKLKILSLDGSLRIEPQVSNVILITTK